MGKPLPASGKVPHACRHEVSTNLKERVEGTRLKHWLNGNSIKIYDKNSVLRVETLIRDPAEFKVLRQRRRRSGRAEDLAAVAQRRD